MKKELEALENWLSNSLIDLRVQCNEKRLTKDIYDNNVEKVKRDYNIIKQALTRPLDSELEEIFKNVNVGCPSCESDDYYDYQEHRECKNCGKTYNLPFLAEKLESLRQALRLTPKITSEEIVKELNDYQPNKHYWEFKNNNFYLFNGYYNNDNGSNIVESTIAYTYLDLKNIPINLAHKITTFFIQESESE